MKTQRKTTGRTFRERDAPNMEAFSAIGRLADELGRIMDDERQRLHPAAGTLNGWLASDDACPEGDAAAAVALAEFVGGLRGVESPYGVAAAVLDAIRAYRLGDSDALPLTRSGVADVV